MSYFAVQTAVVRSLVPKRTHWGMYFMISYKLEEDTKYWEMC